MWWGFGCFDQQAETQTMRADLGLDAGPRRNDAQDLVRHARVANNDTANNMALDLDDAVEKMMR